MRHILILFFFILSSQISAQTYSVRKTQRKSIESSVAVDSFTVNSLYRAGEHLKRSANFQYSAIGCTAAATLFTSVAVGTEQKALFIPAGVFGFGAILSEIFAIHHKMEAGRELIISSNKIQFKF